LPGSGPGYPSGVGGGGVIDNGGAALPGVNPGVALDARSRKTVASAKPTFINYLDSMKPSAGK